jgi:hypothetical protein
VTGAGLGKMNVSAVGHKHQKCEGDDLNTHSRCCGDTILIPENLCAFAHFTSNVEIKEKLSKHSQRQDCRVISES